MEDQGSFRASRSIPTERGDGSAPMLERMTLAIHDMTGCHWAAAEPAARAALEAIREPSEAMIEAAQEACDHGLFVTLDTDTAQVAHRAMIDAILQGKA